MLMPFSSFAHLLNYLLAHLPSHTHCFARIGFCKLLCMIRVSCSNVGHRRTFQPCLTYQADSEGRHICCAFAYGRCHCPNLSVVSHPNICLTEANTRQNNKYLGFRVLLAVHTATGMPLSCVQDGKQVNNCCGSDADTVKQMCSR